MPFLRKDNSPSKDKSSSIFRRFLGSRDHEIEGRDGTSSLVQTRSNPSLHHATSPSVTSSSSVLRPDIKHARSAPTNASGTKSYDPDHITTAEGLPKSIQSVAAVTTTANGQTAPSIGLAATDEQLLQEKVSLWDRAYDSLKANDDVKVKKLVDEYETLLQKDLLSGKIRVVGYHPININSIKSPRCG